MMMGSCASPKEPKEEVIEREISPAKTEVVQKTKTVTEEVENIQYITHKKEGEYGYVTMYPEETKALLNNPSSGIYVIENAPAETLSLGRVSQWDDVNTMAILSSWGEIEKFEDEYDWTTVDAAVKYWTNRGKRIVFRISTDAMIISGLMKYASEVPSYLFDKYGVHFERREMQGVFYRVPDYANVKFLERMEKFMKAFAGRYKNNPSVEGVMLLGYGPWGEWHSGHSFDSYEQREQTLAKIIKIWADAWGPDMPLFLSSTYEYDQTLTPPVSNPTSFEEFKKWSAFDYAWKVPNISFARNGVGGALKEYDSRLLMESFHSNKRVPVQLELYAGYAEYSQLGGYAGYTEETALQEILMYRANVMTVMGWDLFGAPRYFEERPDLVYKMNRYLGYRLMPRQLKYPSAVTPGSNFELEHIWVNDAVGRATKDYNLAFYFVDEKGKVAFTQVHKNLATSNMTYGNVYANTTEISVPKTLSKGIYTIKLALTDEKGQPAIELGITGNDGTKRYTVGRIQVASKAQKPVTQKAFKYGKALVVKSNSFIDAGLKADTAYEISFDYQMEAGSQAELEFAVVRKNGDEKTAKAVNRWMDVSGKASRKTFYVSLENHADYQLRFSAKNGQSTVSNITVKPVEKVFSETFDGGSLDDIPLVFGEDVKLTDAASETPNQSPALTLTGSGVDSVDLVGTFADALKFEPNTTYTVSFDYKTLTDARQGAYAYLELTDGEQVRSTHFWADLVGNGAKTLTFTFTTDENENYALYFGICRGLTISIDNLLVVRHSSAIRVKARDDTASAPVAPVIQEIPFPFEADFETGNLMKSGMLPGDMSFGSVSSNKKAVIDGKFSVMGDNDGSVLWMIFLNTDIRKVVLKPETTYTISFDTKTIRKQHNEGGFMTYLRTDLGTFNDDRGYVLWDAYGNLKELGPDMSADDVNIHMKEDGTGRVEYRVTTGNKENYSLYFCIKYGGAFSVDNLKIQEGNHFVKKQTSKPAMEKIKFDIHGYSENFEAGPMQETDGESLFRRTLLLGGNSYTRDIGFYSRFTTEKSKVISGKYSIFGENVSGTWYDFLKSNSARIPLHDGQTYYLKFKFKAHSLAQGAHYALTLKSDTHPGYNEYLWWNDAGKVVGTSISALSYQIKKTASYDIIELKFTPKTGPGNYYLVWGINGNGSASFDDIVISANDPTYSSANLVTWDVVVGKLR